ncbi:MAG TPA: pyridoxamine 5'-phosphate oxidase [Verrucomicrobiales bacterium]|nr:pyridoxamine 5'-phosphate oxidase [Verrucomicrobiales bacterium]HIL69302.1 pyridoxamine 5'-phosphate oxidase [Verrucomicrobiota bacterium]
MDLEDLRREYQGDGLDLSGLDPDPIRQFSTWFDHSQEAEVIEPNAMTLSTCDSDGCPSSRTVLLKYFDSNGFVFFTNFESRKACQILGNANVSLLFPWLKLERQVEINGVAEKVSAVESARYFVTRPRESQLGAWVSHQSSVLSSRKILEQKLVEMKRKFNEGKIPFPSFWGGFRVKPRSIEFWQGGAGRLHDRFRYTRDEGDGWKISRLAP